MKSRRLTWTNTVNCLERNIIDEAVD
jgi:hypothetical protein